MMKLKATKIVSLILLVLAVAFGVRAQHADGDMIMLKPEDSRVVALGATVYQENCALCHGANLEGQADWRTPLPGGGFRAPPHDETGHTWHHPDGQLFQITKLGRNKYMATILNQPNIQSDMPGFEGTLSDDEIIAVLSYIKSTWPPHITVQHDLVNRGVHPQE